MCLIELKEESFYIQEENRKHIKYIKSISGQVSENYWKNAMNFTRAVNYLINLDLEKLRTLLKTETLHNGIWTRKMLGAINTPNI